ncbi:hypothetical protein TNCT_6471 [Trichonephila clavata]|uniref:Uncharacterized protein n=1 Tax=Trichonephila clavata TaxID=2740835 RepID=A0A8X6HF01_TRICU|nr:hypothetical protein TNCT_6471 [Trichonephila clavata]
MHLFAARGNSKPTRSFPNKDGTARGIFPGIREPVDPDEGSTNSKSEGRNSRKFRGPGLPKATSGPAFEKSPDAPEGVDDSRNAEETVRPVEESESAAPRVASGAPRFPITPTCRLGPPRPSGNDEIRTPGGTGCPLSEFQVRFPIAPRLFRAGAPRGAFFPISRPSETHSKTSWDLDFFFEDSAGGPPRDPGVEKKINSRGFGPRKKNAKKPDRGRCDRLPDPNGHSFDAAPPGPRARVFLFRVFPKVVEIRQKCTFSPPGETRSFPNKDGTARGIFPEIRDPVDPEEGSTNSKSEGRNSRKFRVPGLPKATSGPAFEKARPRGARLRKRQRRRPVEGPAGDNFRVGPRTSVREPGPPECFRGPALRRGRFRGRDRKRRVFEFVSTGPTRKYESEFAKAQVSVSEAEEYRTQNSISTPRTKLSRDTTFLRRDQSPYTLRIPEELVATKRNGCGF